MVTIILLFFMMKQIYKRYNELYLNNNYGIELYKINNYRDKHTGGYDERYKKNNNTHESIYNVNNNRIIELKKMYGKKNILDSLLNENISIDNKLALLYDNDYMFNNFTINNNMIKQINLFEGGLLKDF
jgi:hypothetical protein